MLIRVEPSRDEPVFLQIAGGVRSELAAGRLRPGDRLPAARDVAAAVGVNLHTVLRGYQVLRDEGLIDMRRGRGAVVTDAAASLTRLHDDIAALAARAEELGISPDTLASLIKEHG